MCYIYILQNSRKKLFPVALSFACNRHCTLLLSAQPEQIIAIYYGLLLTLNHAAILLSHKQWQWNHCTTQNFCLVYFEDSWDDQHPAKHILMKIRGKTVISMVLLLKPHIYMHRCRSVTLCLKLVLLLKLASCFYYQSTFHT